MNLSSISNVGSFLVAPQQGITRGLKMGDTAGKQISQGDLDPEAFIHLNEASLLVKANVAVMRTGDEMLGSLLNIRA